MTEFIQPRGAFSPPDKRVPCGPYILSLLSSKSIDYINEWVRWNIMPNRGLDKIGRRRGVRSMYMDGMARFLQSHHIRVMGLNDYVFADRKTNPTLTQWFKHRANKKGTYIILLGRHFLLVQGRMVICSGARTWTPMSHKRRLKRAKVWQVIELYL